MTPLLASNSWYQLVQSIPEQFFPGGVTVYNMRVEECIYNLGYAFSCYDLFWWREAFHLMGGVILLILYSLSCRWLIGRAIIYAIVVYVCVQELYIHPTFSGQVWWKTIADLLFWLAPIMIVYSKKLYLFLKYKIMVPLVRSHTALSEYIRLNIVSLVSTVADFFVYAGCYYVLNSGVSSAVVVGAVVGGVVSFVLNDRFAIGSNKTGKELASEFFRYLLVWVTSTILNTLLTVWLVPLSSPMIARVVAGVVVGILWNYSMYHFYVFIRKNRRSV